MTAGTTELRLSEDLWAQVESRMVQVPHTEAEWPLDRGDSEGWSKPAWCVAYVGIGLNPHAGSGRLHAELHGAWGLKPYRGQPDVRKCVQKRLARSVGGESHRGRSQEPRSWTAGWRETEPLKPVDKPIGRMGSESLGRNERERTVASKVGSPRGRARFRRAKAAWLVAP